MSANWLPIRVARANGPGWNLGKTLLQTVLFWSSLLWAVPLAIRSVEVRYGLAGFRPWPLLGWPLFFAASALGLWSAWTMAWFGEGTPLPLDTARRFVTQGPYRWIRNPMATAGLAQGMAVAVITGSYATLIYPFIGGVIWQHFVRPAEEADLAARFGAPYEDYRRHVSCWWPR
ncbi:MAG: isoprenylcysteine carboxylmethyltransferase family protein [Bryobacterales bacterium]|nr:isoprenylcysteine carboxylmethyltransferase family protein [Bryobacterales bacterium]